jgi:colanic acid/amylovoran biosynthesis glycosyltransferase
MYNQIRYLPADVENHIICERTENLEQFHLPNIHSLWQTSRTRYCWDKGIRKVGLRHHLDFVVTQSKKQSAHLLHSHFGPAGWANIAASKRANLKHVVTFYGQDVNYFPQSDNRWYGRYRELFAQVDAVLCEGPHMAQCVIELGCPATKVHVHHLGVAVHELAFAPRSWQPSEPLRILIAASFQEKKGIPYALAALGQLQQEVPLSVTMIGDANAQTRSQVEKRRIVAAIEQYGLQSCTRLLGYQPYPDFLKEAYQHHIFLSPSVTASDGDTEGGAPVSLIEIAATGMPIVSTTHCDIPEVIIHGQTGLLAAERNVDELVECLRHLIRTPERWRSLTVAGRQHVEREFNATVQGERLGEIYRRIVTG